MEALEHLAQIIGQALKQYTMKTKTMGISTLRVVNNSTMPVATYIKIMLGQFMSF